MPQFSTMGERAWWAWQCLERDTRGQPPEWRDLERKHGLTNGAIYKFVWGVTTKPQWDTLEKLAAALRTSPEWLRREEGPGPMARWPVLPRPAPPEGAARRAKKHKSGQMPSVRVGKG